MTVPQVLVTGASGLVGEALVLRLLLDSKFQPVATARGATRLHGLCKVVPFDLTGDQRVPALDNIQVVVHSAARVHVMDEVATDALAAFRKVNVEGTLRLARDAAVAGVQRFVFISSIKVNGESTLPGRPFTADDRPAPVEAYGVSKYEAEEGLKQIALNSGMEVVIIRPPLVYGPGVKANFLSLLRWLNTGVPLPLGAIHNQRSLVSVANLVDLIVTCLNHPAAANQTFLAGDGEDLSTTQLLKRLGGALGKKPRLLPIPSWMLSSFAALVGKQTVAKRICGSLQVDIGKNREQLGWIPPISVDKALRQTADDYLDKQTK